MLQIIPVHQTNAAVDDGLLNRFETGLAADDQFTQGQNEICLQADRAFVFRIVQVNVHRIDVLLAVGRDVDDLPLQQGDQRRILAFGIADDDVIVSDQKGIGHFPLCRERLAGTGSTKNQAVGVFELLAVSHDHVVADGIDAVIQRFAALKQLLRRKRNKDRSGRCGQAALDVDLVQAERKAAHQPLFLLEVQTLQRTVVFLCDTSRLKNDVVQLLLGLCRVENQHRHKEHTLIAALQIFKQLFGLTAVGHEVRGKNVHVISGTDGLFLLLNLHLVEVGDFGLDLLDGLCLIDGLHMEIYNDGIVHVEEICQHLVRKLRGKDLEEGDRADGLAHTKIPAVTEVKARGSNEVLCGQTGTGYHVIIENERLLRLLVHRSVQHLQALITGKRMSRHAHSLQVVDDVRFDPFQFRLRYADALCLDAEGHILHAHEAVVSLCQLRSQDTRIFLADIVEIVIPARDLNGGFHLSHVCVLTHAADLERDTGVKVVVEVTPELKGRCLILILCQLVVDIPELDALGIMPVIDAADAVFEHLLIGNALLHRMGNLPFLLFLQFLLDQALLLFAGKNRADFLIISYAGLCAGYDRNPSGFRLFCYWLAYRLSGIQMLRFVFCQCQEPPSHKFLPEWPHRSYRSYRAGHPVS